MSARAIAIHGNEKSGERRANLEIKSECPGLINILYIQVNQRQRLIKTYARALYWVGKKVG